MTDGSLLTLLLAINFFTYWGSGLLTLKVEMNLVYLAPYFTAGLTSIIYSAFYCAWFLFLRLCGSFPFAEKPSLTNGLLGLSSAISLS